MQNTRFIVNYSHSWWTIVELVWVANNIVLCFGLNLCLQQISHRPTIFTLYLQFRASFKIIGFKSRDQKEEHGIKKQQIFQNPMAWCILLNKKTWQVHCSPLALLLLRILWSCCGCQLLGQAATVPDDEDNGWVEDAFPGPGPQARTVSFRECTCLLSSKKTLGPYLCILNICYSTFHLWCSSLLIPRQNPTFTRGYSFSQAP